MTTYTNERTQRVLQQLSIRTSKSSNSVKTIRFKSYWKYRANIKCFYSFFFIVIAWAIHLKTPPPCLKVETYRLSRFFKLFSEISNLSHIIYRSLSANRTKINCCILFLFFPVKTLQTCSCFQLPKCSNYILVCQYSKTGIERKF